MERILAVRFDQIEIHKYAKNAVDFTLAMELTFYPSHIESLIRKTIGIDFEMPYAVQQKDVYYVFANWGCLYRMQSSVRAAPYIPIVVFDKKPPNLTTVAWAYVLSSFANSCHRKSVLRDFATCLTEIPDKKIAQQLLAHDIYNTPSEKQVNAKALERLLNNESRSSLRNALEL